MNFVCEKVYKKGPPKNILIQKFLMKTMSRFNYISINTDPPNLDFIYSTSWSMRKGWYPDICNKEQPWRFVAVFIICQRLTAIVGENTEIFSSQVKNFPKEFTFRELCFYKSGLERIFKGSMYKDLKNQTTKVG